MIPLLLTCLLCTFSILPQEQWRPDFYQPCENQQTPQMMHALKEVPKLMLSGNESVLDVGCGDGAITSYIAQNLLKNGAIHAIDISQSMIEKATASNAALNASFECISFFDYKPKDGYDVVVCFWVLYLFENYAQALEAVISNLKPGGKALICHIVDPGTPFVQLFKKTIAPQPLPIMLPTLDTVIKAIEQAPVSIEYLELKYNYDSYKNFDQFYASMSNIPFFALLEEDKKALFYQELLSLYKPDHEGHIHDYAQIVCMILQKNAC